MKKRTMEHTELLVLSLLSQGDLYGYQMIVELERRSERAFDMKEGTLYPILHGLERQGAVEAYEAEGPNGRVRKYYRLTKKGGKYLKERREEWRSYSEAVNAVLRSCEAG